MSLSERSQKFTALSFQLFCSFGLFFFFFLIKNRKKAVLLSAYHTALSQWRLSCVMFESLPSEGPEYKNPSFFECCWRLGTIEISEFSNFIFHEPLQCESYSSAKAVHTLLPATGRKCVCSASNFQELPLQIRHPPWIRCQAGSQRLCAIWDIAAALGGLPARNLWSLAFIKSCLETSRLVFSL